MFNKLVASQGKKSFWNPTTVTTSVVFHALLLAGAVYASQHMPPDMKKKADELVTFMDVKEPEPPKPEEPPPPPPPEEKPKNTPPPPKGFQELVPPKEPPPNIPDVDLSKPAVDPKDFTGIGAAGGTHNGVEGGTPQKVEAPVDSSNFAYEVAVLQKKPELKNKSQVASMLSRFYPRMLQDAGIGGQTMMQFVIEKDGTIDPSTVKVVSSTHEQFADASTKVVEKFRFSPGLYKGQPVRVLIQMPITWQPQG